MLKTIIVDDEPMARETIAEMLKLYCEDIEIVGQAEDVQSGITAIQGKQPDLVLLDIQLTDGTGFDLLKQLNNHDFKVIFITAYEDYAIKAFKFSAMDYVLKPVDPSELIAAVDRARQSIRKENMNMNISNLLSSMNNHSNEPKRIVLKTANNVHLVNLEEIVRCQSDKNYTHFFIKDQPSIVVSKTLKEYDDILAEHKFYRVHQSHLVNIAHVVRYEKGDGGYLVMSDDSVVPVSFRKKEDLMRMFSNL